MEEINKCLSIKGYCRRLLQRLASLPHGKLHAWQTAQKTQGSTHGSSHQRSQDKRWQRKAA